MKQVGRYSGYPPCYHINRYRIYSGKQQSEFDRVAVAGSVSLHCIDGVDNIQIRFLELIYFEKQPCKQLPGAAGFEMPAGLFRPDNRSEQIFDGAGHRHHFMRFQLRQVDDFIGLVIVTSQPNRAKCSAPPQFDSFNKFNKSCSAVTCRFTDTTFISDFLKTAYTGAVADQRDAARFLYKFGNDPYQVGVCGDGLTRFFCSKHIRLEQYPISVTDKLGDAAKRFKQFDYVLAQSLKFVITGFNN